jgi:prepilin-type N-terminal cleavage/methylation domain-containing protein
VKDSKHIINANRQFPKSRIDGFSLIELLVSIAVIAILAAILIPVISVVRSSAEAAVCATNMRQIGQAIQLHVSDNNGRLPGPTYREQALFYQWNSAGIRHQGHLISHLAPYLEGEPKGSGSGGANLPSFLCPSWVSSKGFLPGELITKGVAFQAERRFFGFYHPDPEKSGGQVLMSQITPEMMKMAVLWETDQMDGTAYGNSKNERLAEAPVHKSHRHYLYIDGAVRAIALDEQDDAQIVQNAIY